MLGLFVYGCFNYMVMCRRGFLPLEARTVVNVAQKFQILLTIAK
jgi:hypothetical protein